MQTGGGKYTLSIT